MIEMLLLNVNSRTYRLNEKDEMKMDLVSKIFTSPIKGPYIVTLIALAILCFFIFLPRIENFFVFFPDSEMVATPETFLIDYRDIFFDQDGEKLHGWLCLNRRASSTILFCHGNAENISHRLEYINSLLTSGFQVFIFDYQGYGKSRGRPSEQGIYRAGLAAYDYLVNKEGISPEKIIVFGHSLGAAVAIEVSLQRETRALIIESAFTSIREMAGTIWLFKPISFFIPRHYNNLKKIEGINVPKLMIHGDNDGVVPYSMGRKLFEKAGSPKFFYTIKGTGHNDTSQINPQDYFRTIAYFARHLSLP